MNLELEGYPDIFTYIAVFLYVYSKVLKQLNKCYISKCLLVTGVECI